MWVPWSIYRLEFDACLWLSQWFVRLTLLEQVTKLGDRYFSVTALAVEVKAEEASPTCHNLHVNRFPAIIVRTNPTPTTIIIGVIGNPPPF